MPDDNKDVLRELRDELRSMRLGPKPASDQTVRDLGTKVFELKGALEEVRSEFRSETKVLRDSLGVTNMAVKALDERVTAEVAKRPTITSAPPRSMSPMPRRYDPEKTDGGTRRYMSAEEWNEVEATLEEHGEALAGLQKERDAAKEAERRAQEKQANITEYAMKLEKESGATRKRVRKWALLLVAVTGGVVEGLHFLLSLGHH